jgi:hypothetical protein
MQLVKLCKIEHLMSQLDGTNTAGPPIYKQEFAVISEVCEFIMGNYSQIGAQ